MEDDAYIGPAAVILPHVRIGRGAVVTAGSVVTRSVPPMTMVQGNPAKVVARCGIPLTWETPIKKFYSNLRPLGVKSAVSSSLEPHPNGDIAIKTGYA